MNDDIQMLEEFYGLLNVADVMIEADHVALGRMIEFEEERARIEGRSVNSKTIDSQLGNFQLGRERLLRHLGHAIEVGENADRRMKGCFLMFELLNSFDAVSKPQLVEVRAEVSELIYVLEKLIMAEWDKAHGESKPKSVDPFVAHCKTTSGSHRDKAKAWIYLHPDETRKLEQLKRKSERIKP